ncbi:MAG: tRNA (adenosine(37)-N6)-threonylcarbamoyltransferase complex dimerization subunit type 1 TsaB [Bacteroidetes bacterium]|nr:tRNA (adenosine(37)-N6)-threonylcarbamoyltransferase complex dimerization subunit type 1 TsaB [Bacteroidota bacterium]
MSLILGIETATKICSVAISRDEKLLALKEIGGEYSHSENLNHFIELACAEAKITLNQLDAIVVSKGPGSYTGLRIGVSTAKGLCYGLDKPLIAVDTLKAMVVGVTDSLPFGEVQGGVLFCPMIDARRMEVYTALYISKFELIEPISAKIIDENSFAHFLDKNKVVFFGDGAEKCKSLLNNHPNAVFIDNVEPSAQYVNQLASSKFKQGIFEDVAYFEPYYLKEFLATTSKKKG